MILSEIKDKFHVELNSIYPKSEIESIFKILAKHLLDYDAADLILQKKEKTAKGKTNLFLNSLNRLKNNEPLQYIIGKTIFYDLEFTLTPDVLIPRPETEELVDWIIFNLQKNKTDKHLKILDIGTGSGCIAISLAKNIPNATVWAVDISNAALKIAKHNANKNDVNVHFNELDIINTETLPDIFDVIVSNPPYVTETEKAKIHSNVLEHEPSKALFVPNDNPLLFYDKITNLAQKNLASNGQLYFEINQYLGKETYSLLISKGFSTIELKKDFANHDRMIKANK